jgi:3-hydroxymyristoyl/3-hydroxydecanoyl-(acyl carrier protein) dehydratase
VSLPGSVRGGGAAIPLAIPSSGPLFEGHFPGRPILPGIALLDLALRSLPAAPGGTGLLGIDRLRLRRLVLPGDRLALEAAPAGPDGGLRLAVRRGEDLVADGVVSRGDLPAGAEPEKRPVAGQAPARAAAPAAAPSGVPDLDLLLPHRPPMRFVETIEAEAEEGLACTARVPGASPFAREGDVPALVAIEMAAQAAAVFEALRRRRACSGDGAGAGPRVGYLVGASGVRFFTAGIPAGAGCRVAIRLAGLAGPLSTYAFTVDRGGVPAADGTVSTWLTATDA